MTQKSVNRIKEIWEVLERNPPLTDGITKVRFSDTSHCDLYLGKKTPEDLRLLTISVSIEVAKSSDRIQDLKGLRVDKIINPQKEGFVFINLILSDCHFSDIFDVLISDIITNVIDLTDEKEIAQAFLNRISQWQSLFEKFRPEGLTEEMQKGLYGELYFLKRTLINGSRYLTLIKSWVGSENAIQDFQFGESAIEVKISSGKNHQKIQISNERQLDESFVKNLFLFHISLDARPSYGKTLNEIISEIREVLKYEVVAYSLFNHKLIEAGYFDIHKHLYSVIGYNIRAETYYKVFDQFPRLKEKDIPDGVGDIKYTINISDCSEYSVPEPDVFKLIL